MKRVINPSNSPKPIGTYNQAIESNGFIFTSGQVGIDHNTGKIVDGGIESQVSMVFKNIECKYSWLKLS